MPQTVGPSTTGRAGRRIHHEFAQIPATGPEVGSSGLCLSSGASFVPFRSWSVKALATTVCLAKRGPFLPCSFWLLEALLRLGRVEEGLRVFEQVLGLANELLLLPEEIDPETGAYLGNYPLALSQAGLVHAVLEVQRVLNA
jgi:hypothetical protein